MPKRLLRVMRALFVQNGAIGGLGVLAVQLAMAEKCLGQEHALPGFATQQNPPKRLLRVMRTFFVRYGAIGVRGVHVQPLAALAKGSKPENARMATLVKVTPLKLKAVLAGLSARLFGARGKTRVNAPPPVAKMESSARREHVRPETIAMESRRELSLATASDVHDRSKLLR